MRSIVIWIEGRHKDGEAAIDEEEGKVIYQYGDGDTDRVEMDYLDFIARVTAHIPDKGQVMIRYYALYSNAHRGKEKKQGEAATRNHLHPQEAPTGSPARGTLLIQHNPRPLKGTTMPE
jgi:hypothetical protein